MNGWELICIRTSGYVWLGPVAPDNVWRLRTWSTWATPETNLTWVAKALVMPCTVACRDSGLSCWMFNDAAHQMSICSLSLCRSLYNGLVQVTCFGWFVEVWYHGKALHWNSHAPDNASLRIFDPRSNLLEPSNSRAHHTLEPSSCFETIMNSLFVVDRCRGLANPIFSIYPPVPQTQRFLAGTWRDVPLIEL